MNGCLRWSDGEADGRASTQSGDIAWMITSTALVLLMIPGVGYVFDVACFPLTRPKMV